MGEGKFLKGWGGRKLEGRGGKMGKVARRWDCALYVAVFCCMEIWN